MNPYHTSSHLRTIVATLIVALCTMFFSAPPASAGGGAELFWSDASATPPGFVEPNPNFSFNTEVYAASHSTFTMEVSARTKSGKPLTIVPGTINFGIQGPGITGFTIDPANPARATYTTGDDTGTAINSATVSATVQVKPGEYARFYLNSYVYVMDVPEDIE